MVTLQSFINGYYTATVKRGLFVNRDYEVRVVYANGANFGGDVVYRKKFSSEKVAITAAKRELAKY